MLKPFAMLAGVGVLGVVAFKVLGVLLLPILGMFLGFLMWALKIAFIVGLIWWGMNMFKRWSSERGSEA